MKRLLLASLVLLTAACADDSATQYVGSVMRESAPDSAGALRLTFFSRDDSSFSGVIELDAPARGTGSAYAWHEGSELRVVTVAAQSSDTILWVSPLTDEGLGGWFEVTGGDRAGERGTWRASLAKGPPATLATLHAPPPPALPPIIALWPLPLLLAVGVGLARWIRRAPVATAAGGGVARVPPWQEGGVAGWLLLFTLGHVLAVVAGLVGLRSAWDDLLVSVGVGTVVTGLLPLVVLETAMRMLSVPVAIGGLVLLMRRSPYAPRYWFAYLAGSGVYLLIELLAMLSIQPQLVRLLGAEAVRTSLGGTNSQVVSRLLASVIWALYWVRSRRVRATFGAAALDRFVTAPAVPTDSMPPAPRARDGRWWRRVVLRTVGGAIAVFLALVAIGLWSIRATPYSVPEGADIRETVAGRWAWSTDTAGCRKAHTIAFAADGKVMTITGSDSSVSGPVTTYDVEFTTRSMIRGAIRGETRKTSEGVPVVWELVLTGPDEYRWRRTDLPATPWSYTAGVRRCPDRTAGVPDAGQGAVAGPGRAVTRT